jgi:hypothetical protein
MNKEELIYIGMGVYITPINKKYILSNEEYKDYKIVNKGVIE